MSPQLRKDIEYVLLKLIQLNERPDAGKVLRAIEGFIPERKGIYALREVEAALQELERESSNNN